MIRATSLSTRESREGSFESEETALRRGRLDIALTSVLSDTGLRISEAAALSWRDVLDAEDRAALFTSSARRPTKQVRTCTWFMPDTLVALKLLRSGSEAWSEMTSC